MIISLVRHGEPIRGAVGDLRNDPPLSAIGVAQMAAVGRELLRPDGFDAVYASNLRRASQSARCAVGPDLPVVEVADLAEFDRDAEYLHYEDGAEIWQRYRAGDLSPWGTTPEAFRGRVVAAMEMLRQRHTGQRVVAVCHGGVINIFTTWILGLSGLRVFAPTYGSVSRYTYTADRGWSIRELNARPCLTEAAVGADSDAEGASWN